MLVEIASVRGWIRADLPEPVAKARIAGGTARLVIEEPKREFAMIPGAVENAARNTTKAVSQTAKTWWEKMVDLYGDACSMME